MLCGPADHETVQGFQLHAAPEQHEVARADAGRIIGGPRRYLEITRDAAYPQPALAQGPQVSAPREEVDLGSGPGEPGTEIAPGAPRPVDGYPRHSPGPSVISYCRAPGSRRTRPAPMLRSSRAMAGLPGATSAVKRRMPSERARSDS
jgi:hypothetical protein